MKLDAKPHEVKSVPYGNIAKQETDAVDFVDDLTAAFLASFVSTSIMVCRDVFGPTLPLLKGRFRRRHLIAPPLSTTRKSIP